MIMIILCDFCKHYNSEKQGSCAAFPRGIPDEILAGKVGHVLPMEGDGGIVFEPNSEYAAWATRDLVDIALRRHAAGESSPPPPAPDPRLTEDYVVEKLLNARTSSECFEASALQEEYYRHFPSSNRVIEAGKQLMDRINDPDFREAWVRGASQK